MRRRAVHTYNESVHLLSSDDDVEVSSTQSETSSDDFNDVEPSAPAPFPWLKEERRLEIHHSRCRWGGRCFRLVLRFALLAALLSGLAVAAALLLRKSSLARTVSEAVVGKNGVVGPAEWDAFASSFDRDDTESWHMRTYAESKRLFKLLAAGRASLFVMQIHNAGSDMISHVVGMHEYDPKKRRRVLRRASPACKAMADCSNWTMTYDPALESTGWDCRDRKWLLRQGDNHMDNIAFRLWNMSYREPRRVVRVEAEVQYDCIPGVHSYGFQQLAARSSWLPGERAALASYFAHARFIRGSYVYGLHKLGHRGIDYGYVTAVRNPLGRVMAQWNRWTTVENLKIVHRAFFDTWLYGEMRFQHKKGWPPRWNHKTWGYYMLANHMTRVLCGRSMVRPYPDGTIPREDEITSKDQLLPLGPRELEDAKRNLINDFALVVVVDMVDAELATELQRLCVALFTHAERDALKLQSERHLVANYFERIDHVSVGAANQIHSKDMTPTLRRRVMRLNALDMELYEFAQKLFIKQLGMLRHMYNEKMLAAKLEDLVLGHKPPPTVIRDPIEWI
tara:strand:+ start:2016 stop:3710 length:1695 start_codon:yes stop_codon:yes gene_type:complete